MDNKEKSPEKELIESIGLMIEKGMESNTNIYTGVVKSVDGKRAVVAVNGQNQNVSIATADVSSGNVVRVFVPEGNMSAAFIIKAEASGGGGGTTTTAYGDLTGKPRINGVTLVDNKTSKELKLYGTDNAPPYPVTSVNGQTGDVTISAGGNVDSVNGKTGVVVLNKSDVGLGNVDNVRQYSTSNPPPYPVRSVDGATGAVVTNAVKTTPQSLSDTQKQQVRNNIGAGTSSFDGDYNSLTNKPTIPTKTSQLTNDSGFITDAALAGYAKTTDIPTKTSQLDNDSNYITANEAPVQSVNTKTGAVVLTQDDVGDGTTYVRTHNDFTDALKAQINTNKDNIAMAEGDIDGLQTDVGTLKTNVTSLQTALTSKQDVIVGAASTITEDNLATDRALISNSSGKVAVSNVTSTELGYLDGVTSNVQTQLNKKLEKAPVTSVNSKTGAVQLNASDVGALPDTTVIPTKTSQLDNDSGFISDIPIASATQLGGVKIGAGLSITENGVLSATGGGTADAVEWNNVLDKPTTIAGYGITDAKIENGTITLGDKTITPLTSAPVTSVNSKTGAVVLSANDVGALPADTVIPTVNNATLTIRRNSIDVGSFTANSANDVNIDISVPTDKSDIGLGNVDNVKQYSVSNPPPYPVTSVNGKTGDITLTTNDLGINYKLIKNTDNSLSLVWTE